MTYMPHIPRGLWNILGEDAVYFSQPTEAWFPDVGTRRLDPHTAAARCGETSQMGSHDREAPLTDRAVWSFPIQCGGLATLTPDGRYVCEDCCYKRYTCSVCERYDANCAWLRDLVTCCPDKVCLAAVNAPPVPCVRCKALLVWEEQFAGDCADCARPFNGACWDCHMQEDHDGAQ